MNNILLTCVSVVALTCSTPVLSPAFAQGVPTVDVTSITKLTEMLAETRFQLKEMVDQNLILDEQTKKMIEQVALLQQQLDALRNGLDLDGLNIGQDFLKDILPPDFRNIIAAIETGNMSLVTGSGAHGTFDAQKAGDLLKSFYEGAGIDGSTVDALASSEVASDARIGKGAQAAAGLSLAAQASAEEASEGLERVDALVRKIPGTDNLKQAIDLNTRVTAELAIAMANIWSMQAAQTISLGQMGVIDAATLADDAKFLDLGRAD